MAVRETLHNISLGTLIGWVGGAVIAAVGVSASYAAKAADYYIPLWLQAAIAIAFFAVAMVAVKKKRHTELLLACKCMIIVCLSVGAYFAFQHKVREGEEAAPAGTVSHAIQRILPANL